MLGNVQKHIIIRALLIHMEKGENPEAILKTYTKLTEDERNEIRELIKI